MNEAVQVYQSRPKTIPIVAAFLFVATAIASIAGVSLLFPNRLLHLLWKLNPEGAVLFHSIGPVSGVSLLALAAGTFAAARGLLAGRRWAWWFSVALFAIDACGNVVSYFLIHDALSGHYRRDNLIGISYCSLQAYCPASFPAPGTHSKPQAIERQQERACEPTCQDRRMGHVCDYHKQIACHAWA